MTLRPNGAHCSHVVIDQLDRPSAHHVVSLLLIAEEWYLGVDIPSEDNLETADSDVTG